MIGIKDRTHDLRLMKPRHNWQSYSVRSLFFKYLFFRFFKNDTPTHGSNIWLLHVQKENKIHRGISVHSSVQTTTKNQAKSPISPFFKNSPKFKCLRFFKNNTPKHSSNICSFYVPKENNIHRGISEHSSVQSSAPRCRQTDRRTDEQTDMVHRSYYSIERISNLKNYIEKKIEHQINPSHNVVLTTSLSQRFSLNVFLLTYFSKRVSHNS